jgi:hypothetical protein
MISVGSGNCVLFEANQLQADRQANVASKRTLNHTPRVRYVDITVARRASVNFLFPRWLYVKFHLTVGEILRLLLLRGASKLWVFNQFIQRRMHMTTTILTLRFAQALCAVIATAASVLVFQFAMLVG